VWGQALRNEMWGEPDPEWTAGDDAAGFTPRATVPTYPSNAAAETGELCLTSRLHGRVLIPGGNAWGNEPFSLAIILFGICLTEAGT